MLMEEDNRKHHYLVNFDHVTIQLNDLNYNYEQKTEKLDQTIWFKTKSKFYRICKALLQLQQSLRTSKPRRA